MTIICRSCAVHADTGYRHTPEACEQEGCTCQHKNPGAWKGERTQEKLPPSLCSVCEQPVVVTPLNRVSLHMRKVETFRNGITITLVCFGSGRPPLVRDIVPSAISLLELGADD